MLKFLFNLMQIAKKYDTPIETGMDAPEVKDSAIFVPRIDGTWQTGNSFQISLSDGMLPSAYNPKTNPADPSYTDHPGIVTQYSAQQQSYKTPAHGSTTSEYNTPPHGIRLPGIIPFAGPHDHHHLRNSNPPSELSEQNQPSPNSRQDPHPLDQVKELHDSRPTRSQIGGVKHTITIPKGFIFDGASIPRLFWTVIGTTPFNPKTIVASCVHDWYCNYATTYGQRVIGDACFYYLLRTHNVGWLRATLMYAGVRVWSSLGSKQGKQK